MRLRSVESRCFRLTGNINRQFPVKLTSLTEYTINSERYGTAVSLLTESLLTEVNHSKVGILTVKVSVCPSLA